MNRSDAASKIQTLNLILFWNRRVISAFFFKVITCFFFALTFQIPDILLFHNFIFPLQDKYDTS